MTEQNFSAIWRLRKTRLSGDEIAEQLGICRSSVFRALRKLGCSRLSSLEEKEPVQRYEWEKPGQMLHLDIKRLGKIGGVGHKKAGTRQVTRRRPGWEYLHVCVDDASRAAYTAVFPDETAESAVEFLWFALAWYASHGIKVERVLTDNGACYKSWKFREACREFGIKHKRTRPYRPQTNGKAERFIRTALNEWAAIAAGPWLGHVTTGWTKLTSVARLVSTRESKGKTTEYTRYFISSLPPDAQEIGRAVREHWRIENTLHWSLDVVFKEDSIRVRKDNSPENLAIIRRIAFSLAKERTPQKMTTKRAQLYSILNQKFAEAHFFKD